MGLLPARLYLALCVSVAAFVSRLCGIFVCPRRLGCICPVHQARRVIFCCNDALDTKGYGTKVVVFVGTCVDRFLPLVNSSSTKYKYLVIHRMPKAVVFAASVDRFVLLILTLSITMY